jgi:hypothetical protein
LRAIARRALRAAFPKRRQPPGHAT